VFPVGIDPSSPVTVVDPDIASMQASLGTRRLILAVDPLDRAKGIPERLAAFEYLLERYPEWRRKVTLVQIASPTRVTSIGYDELRTHIEFLVGRINGMYGEADWVPVRYLYRSYSPSMLAQSTAGAEVALVTPLRDGMNLVAKEFVAAQDLEQPGVLVLSRFAGAAVELTDAILTNPHHAAGLAADIDRALRMPLDERRVRASRLAAIVASTSPARWATAFLDRLDAAARVCVSAGASLPRTGCAGNEAATRAEIAA
jgi:trehalose 6-phosphate synthase